MRNLMTNGSLVDAIRLKLRRSALWHQQRPSYQNRDGVLVYLPRYLRSTPEALDGKDDMQVLRRGHQSASERATNSPWSLVSALAAGVKHDELGGRFRHSAP